VKNPTLDARTITDVDEQVAKVLRGLGNPEPPIDLRLVRELLNLDRHYYRSNDDGVLRETFSKLKVAGIQVLKRPTLLRDAIAALDLKALYLPDQKRILIDASLPKLKHRWNEAHEIGHDIIPWHAGMMLGDTEKTLTPSCHEIMEAEANYAAGQMLFLADRFSAQASDTTATFAEVRALAGQFGNTITSTLWRFVEQGHGDRTLVALVSAHPHPARRPPGFDVAEACRYCVQSPRFRTRFGQLTEIQLFSALESYVGAQSRGPLGEGEVVLIDRNGDRARFRFESFFNGYEALSIGECLEL
jgi:hypothetical protein